MLALKDEQEQCLKIYILRFIYKAGAKLNLLFYFNKSRINPKTMNCWDV